MQTCCASDGPAGRRRQIRRLEARRAKPPPDGATKPPPRRRCEAAAGGPTGSASGAERLARPGGGGNAESCRPAAWPWPGGGGNADPARRRGLPGPAAAETAPQPGDSPATTRTHATAKNPATGQAIWLHLASSPSPTPLGTAIHTKPRIRAIGRHEAHAATPESLTSPARALARPAPGGVKPVNRPRRTAPLPQYDFKSPRLHVAGALKAGAEVTLEKPQAHYLRNVLRLKAGDGVLAFNGKDGEWQATLADGKRAGADPAETDPASRPSRPTCITCSRRSSMSGSTTWCRRRSRWACRGCSRC